MTHRLEIGDDVLVADEYGARGAADTVVLLHGFTGDRTSLAGLAEALAGHRRVLVPDLPGHGETHVGDRPECYSMAYTTTLLAAGLEALGVGRAALAGYSMGGRLALWAALARPDMVGGLVLASASPGLASDAERTERRRRDEELACSLDSRPLSEFVARWESQPLFASQERCTSGVRAELRRQRLQCRPAGLAASLRGMGAGAQPWLGDRLGELCVPTLLIAGGLDVKFTGIAADMLHGLDDGRLEVLDDVGHAVHVEAPERLAHAVQHFLDHHGGARCRPTG